MNKPKNESARRYQVPFKAFGTWYLLMLMSFASVAAAEPFGSSGGMKNESDVAVQVKVTLDSGDYYYEVLAAGSAMNFSENTAKVRIRASIADPPDARSRIRVAVIQPDGSRQRMDALEAEMEIVRKKFPKAV